jgi:mannose-6-phosphate isomerase-like protein (cupin superfamily)
MSTASAAANTSFAARAPGHHRVKRGEFVINFDHLNQIMGGPDCSPVFGECMEGDRMVVALMNAPAIKTSEPHSHPNEQGIFVLEGVMDRSVTGKCHSAHPGEVIYIPAGVMPSASMPEEQDANDCTVKDACWCLHGVEAGS